MGLFGSNIYIMSIIHVSHIQYNFESLKKYYFGKPYICWYNMLYTCVHVIHVQSHPEDRGDFGQGSTANISECNNQPELSVHALTWY